MTRFISDTNVRFGCRVAAVILHDTYVLLQGEPDGAFWTLPGGGIELLEPSEAALHREMREELSIRIRIHRLLWVVEQFFAGNQGRHHELALIYLAEPVDAPHILERRTYFAHEGTVPIIFQWFPIEDLPSVLYPLFLKNGGLKRLPRTPQKVVEQLILLPSDATRRIGCDS